MSERAKFEIIAILVRLAAFSAPFLLTGVGLLYSETQALKAASTELMLWKADADKRESAAASQIKLEILGVVNQTVGSQYLEIRTAIAVMQEKLEQMTKANERRDARDERALAPH